MAAIAPTLAETDPSLAMVLAAEANSRSDDPRTQGALQRVLVAESTFGFIRPGYLVIQAGFDSAGNIVTFGNKQIDVWDATTHRRVDSIAVPEPQLLRARRPIRATGRDRGRSGGVDGSQSRAVGCRSANRRGRTSIPHRRGRSRHRRATPADRRCHRGRRGTDLCARRDGASLDRGRRRLPHAR